MYRPVEGSADPIDVASGPIANQAASVTGNPFSFNPLKACRHDRPIGVVAGG